MIKWILGGFYLSHGQHTQLLVIENPQADDLKNHLEELRTHNGKLILKNNLEDELRPYKMTLYSDNHDSSVQTYMVLLATDLEDGDIDIRTFNDKSGANTFIPMLGEPFAATSTTRDFSLVIRAFSEFLATGDVSTELLE